jgi:hypothetical protein
MGFLYRVVSQYLPFLRKKPKLSRDQALSARPVRNPVLKWERNENGEIRLLVPLRKDRVTRVLRKLLRAPEYKEILLDEVGSDIWELCDGKHTVQSIIVATCKKYKLTRRECEASVGTYLKMLSERNLVGFQLGGRKNK